MGLSGLVGAGGQLLALSRLCGTEKRIQAEDILGMCWTQCNWPIRSRTTGVKVQPSPSSPSDIH